MFVLQPPCADMCPEPRKCTWPAPRSGGTWGGREEMFWGGLRMGGPIDGHVGCRRWARSCHLCYILEPGSPGQLQVARFAPPLAPLGLLLELFPLCLWLTHYQPQSCAECSTDTLTLLFQSKLGLHCPCICG